MSRQIVIQPNGKLAIWSTIVDNFIMTDVTSEEYVQFRIEEETQRLKKEIPEVVAKLKSGQRIGYYDFTWDDALKRIEDIHGKDGLPNLIK